MLATLNKVHTNYKETLQTIGYSHALISFFYSFKVISICLSLFFLAWLRCRCIRRSRVLKAKAGLVPNNVEFEMPPTKRNVAILGCTGSIGTQAIDVALLSSAPYKIHSIYARGETMESQEKIIQQAVACKVSTVGINTYSNSFETALKKFWQETWKNQNYPTIIYGPDVLECISTQRDVDIVLTAVVGSVGISSTVAALRAGKDIALANKETLIAAGPVIINEYRESSRRYPGQLILPVDSEHSAIFQCLQGVPHKDVSRLILTGSGGSFRDLTAQELLDLQESDPDEVFRRASKHPTYDMGAKITVDSATMMNKGLEIIEAHYLFDVPYNKISVALHPQSIIHSAVEFCDGSVLAQMGWPDMRLPIAYALTYPRRQKMTLPHMTTQKPFSEFWKNSDISFSEPDMKKYPCLHLAYQAGQVGGTQPTVLSAANEVAVELFLKKEIPFTKISKIIEEVVRRSAAQGVVKTESITLSDIYQADSWARDEALSVKSSLKL